MLDRHVKTAVRFLLLPLFFCSFQSQASAQSSYCASSANNQNYEWIAKVSFAGADQLSGKSSYSNFSAVSFSATAGEDASITLTPGFASGSYVENWRVWVDLDRNGLFDLPAEELLSQSGNSSINNTISIPIATQAGPTRMRVSMRYGSAPPPCGTFTYGEVEDYTLLIEQGDGGDNSSGSLIIGYDNSLALNPIQNSPFDIESGQTIETAYPYAPNAPVLQHHVAQDIVFLKETNQILVLNGTVSGSSYPGSGVFLSFYDINSGSWEHEFVSGPDPFVDSNVAKIGDFIYIASAGYGLYSQPGIVKYDWKNRMMVDFAPSPYRFATVVRGEDGYLYAAVVNQSSSYGSNEQAIVKFDSNLNQISEHFFQTGAVYDFFVDAAGRFYLITNSSGGFNPTMYLTEYTADGAVGDKLIELPALTSNGEPVYTTDITPCNGNLYIGTNDMGLISVDLAAADGNVIFDENIGLAGLTTAGGSSNGQSSALDMVYVACRSEVVEPEPQPTLAAACSSAGGSQNYEYINAVSSYDSLSGPFGISSGKSGGYADFTESVYPLSISSTSQGAVQLQLTPGFAYSPYNEFWKVWIDYNNDGDFTDAGETVFSGSGKTALDATLLVPLGTAPGVARMRISMKYGSSPNPCETFSWGEVEDYKVEIIKQIP